jgi:hypothetical protein
VRLLSNSVSLATLILASPTVYVAAEVTVAVRVAMANLSAACYQNGSDSLWCLGFSGNLSPPGRLGLATKVSVFGRGSVAANVSVLAR